MRLMDILNEVQWNAGEIIKESASKRSIRKKSNAKRNKALKIGRKLRARKNKINWTDEIRDARDFVVSAFMRNDFRIIIKELAKDTNKKWQIIEIVKALITAHGGEKRLMTAAAKAGKKVFMTKVLAAVKEIEAEFEDNEE